MSAVRLTEADVVSAAKAHIRIVYGGPWPAAFLGLITTFAVLLALPYGGSFDIWPLVWLGLMFAAIAMSYFWTTPRAARRQLRQLASARHPILYRWRDDHFEAVGANGSTKMLWNDLWAWARCRGGYLLYAPGRMYYLIPDRAFGPDADRNVMLAALDANGVPERRPLRRMKRAAP